MIDSIWAKNLLCFDDNSTNVEFAPLTVLVGPNNSGKSTIFTAFNLLRDTTLRLSMGHAIPQWSTNSYNLTDFPTAVYNHKIDKTIQLQAQLRDKQPPITFFVDININGPQRITSNPNWTGVSDLLKKPWFFRASRADVQPQRQTDSGAPSSIWGQPLDSYGSNIITYLLERWTDQDDNWPLARRQSLFDSISERFSYGYYDAAKTFEVIRLESV